MQRFTLQERLQVIKNYYQNSSSVVATQRTFSKDLGRHHRFSDKAIRRIVQKFESEFTLHDTKPPTRVREARSDENIAAVKASVEGRPKTSINRRSQELGLSYSTTWRILRWDLGLHPYKMVLTQKLEPGDHQKRREFADWALENLAENADFGKKSFSPMKHIFG